MVGKNVISPMFSLLNRLQPVRGVLWPNFTEPKCLLVKCSKIGIRQQRTITLDVQKTIVPFFNGTQVILSCYKGVEDLMEQWIK